MRSIHEQKRKEIDSLYQPQGTAIATDNTDVPGTLPVNDDYEDDTIQEKLLDRLSDECLSDERSVHSVIRDVISGNVYENITLEVQSLLTKPPKRRMGPAHESVRGPKDGSENCWWCDATFTNDRCYNFDLQERLCHRCAKNAYETKPLKILKKHIMELEIRCGCCGSLFGSKWTFNEAKNLPTCSRRCSQDDSQRRKWVSRSVRCTAKTRRSTLSRSVSRPFVYDSILEGLFQRCPRYRYLDCIARCEKRVRIHAWLIAELAMNCSELSELIN